MKTAARVLEAEPIEPVGDPAPPRKQVRKRITISPDGSPPKDAATWDKGEGSAGRRYKVLETWRDQVLSSGFKGNRAIKMAWVLSGRFNLERGHCFATDKSLAQKACIPINHVTTALKELEDQGLIIRDHVEDKLKLKRRIWPRLPT